MLKLKKQVPKLFLDSGAFSVWTKKKIIKVHDYGEYILNNLNNFDYFVSLDAIPGYPGKKLDSKDIQEAARLSYKNTEILLKMGVPITKLIPVFHQGEDVVWLKKMLRKFPYVGISPANDKTIYQRVLWLDSISNILFNKNKSPKAKYHGFGVTSIQVMERYNWESVDSRRWLNGAINNYIYCPIIQRNEFDFKKAFECVFAKRDIRGKLANFHNFRTQKLKIVNEWLNYIGQDLNEVYSSYKKRNYCNFLYFLFLQDQINKQKKTKINIVFAGGETVIGSHFLKEDKEKILKYGPSFLLSYIQIKKKKGNHIKRSLIDERKQTRFVRKIRKS